MLLLVDIKSKMNDNNEVWRKSLEEISNESLEGMPEDKRKLKETIQRLLRKSDYGRRPAEIEYSLPEALTPAGILTEDFPGSVNPFSKPHRYIRAAIELTNLGELYLGRFGKISIAPFSGEFSIDSVKIQFTPE